MAEKTRGKPSAKIGVVVSDGMEKSVVVRVDRIVRHSLYARYVRRSAKFMAHDEKNQCKVGDTVEILETRPLSARKHYRVGKILKRSVAVVVAEAETRGTE
jgi:small subunit ribosomal protein S17